MSRSTATASKFVGVTSLGLLTGSSLAFTFSALPALLTFPSHGPVRAAFKHLRDSVHRQQRLLSSVAITSLLTAWALSPRGLRHPYLIWTSLPILGVWGGEWWFRRDAAQSPNEEEALDEELNGERTWDAVAKYGSGMKWKAGAWGLAWVLGMVGLWGDGA